MRKLALPVLCAAVAAVLTACSTSQHTPTQLYYDPNGLFTAALPVDNPTLIIAPQQIAGVPPLLSGVLSVPQQAQQSQQQSQPFALASPTAATDTAYYMVFAVDATGITSVNDLAIALLSASPNVDVKVRQPFGIAGQAGLLVQADHGAYSEASGFVLEGTTGYWIRSLFSPGQWDSRRNAFLDILRSFRPGVPAGVTSIPLNRNQLQVADPGLQWPVG